MTPGLEAIVIAILVPPYLVSLASLGWGLIGGLRLTLKPSLRSRFIDVSVVCRFSHELPFFQPPVASPPPNPHQRPRLLSLGRQHRVRSKGSI